MHDDRVALADLDAAIGRGEIRVALHPIVEIRGGQVSRLEALARWTHPRLGRIGPARFIPLAESAGLITPLTFAVLRDAIAMLSAWRGVRAGLRINLNLSTSTLLEPALTADLTRVLDAAGCDGSCLGIEVTENTLLLEPSKVAAALAGLRSMGMRVEIDDFGTGYSSLGRLIDLPVDALKIDRRFVGAMVSDHRSESIVRASIALAHDLGLETVAEGVEDRETWELLRAHGCDTAQGYYVARPMPCEEVPQWLGSWDAGLEFVHRERIGPTLVAAPRDRSRDVLVVDDEPAILELIRAVLEDEGYRVVTVANGAEALREIDRTLPAVVLLDMQMPLVNGPSFVRALRERSIDVPIVVMTAGSSAARFAKELDTAGYLSKPFDIAGLIDVTGRYAAA